MGVGVGRQQWVGWGLQLQSLQGVGWVLTRLLGYAVGVLERSHPMPPPQIFYGRLVLLRQKHLQNEVDVISAASCQI